DLFRNLGSARLDHHDGLFRPGDDQVQTRLAHFVIRRVDDVATLDETDPHARNRIRKRNVGKIKRTGCARDGDDIRVVVRVCRDDRGDDLCFVAKAFDEERAAGTVNQATGQRLLFIGTTFAPEVVAGNAPGGEV